MNFNLGLTFSGIIYTILIMIIYFKNKRIKTSENKIYSLLLIATIIELLLGLFGYFSIIKISDIPYITKIINTLYLISLDSWILFFMLYVISISLSFESKRIYKIFFIIYLVIIFLISILPINYYYKDNIMYTSGLAVNFTYLIAVLAVIIIIINSIINIKKLSNKKYIPMLVFFVLGGLSLILQIKYPKLFLVSPLEVLVTIVMYFTIENPDMKVIEEIHKAKEISDNANEEKTIFLYNMTNEIRGITKDINKEADNILNETNKKKFNIQVIDDSAREIKSSTAKFTTMTNQILDISIMDGASIKVYNDKYNIKLTLNSLVNKYIKKCNNKNISFRSNISSDIPEYLYGDGINLKKVIDILLDNSIKYTNKGYIELDANVIIKNDIVRLIIVIEDSGIGIDSEKLGTLFVNKKDYKEKNYDLNNTLYNVKKIITLMGGTIIPSSIVGKGTTMKIILDQKLVIDDNKLKQYEKKIDKKDILYIGNNGKLISKILNNKAINLEIIELGKEALDKIRGNKKYDLILLEDDIKPLNGLIIMQKLLMIRSFKTNVILLSKNNEYNYKEYGFSDIILKPIDEKDLINTINKYLK